jgi:hypothetical protein
MCVNDSLLTRDTPHDLGGSSSPLSMVRIVHDKLKYSSDVPVTHITRQQPPSRIVMMTYIEIHGENVIIFQSSPRRHLTMRAEVKMMR